MHLACTGIYSATFLDAKIDLNPHLAGEALSQTGKINCADSCSDLSCLFNKLILIRIYRISLIVRSDR
jgi:hypothetical protein